MVRYAEGMKHEVTKRDIRQRDCEERALRARMYAKVLIIVAVFAAGATVWKDPDMRADATQQAEELRPVAAGFLAGTPLEDLFGPAIAEEAPTPGSEEEDDQFADASDLPGTTRP